MPFSLYDFRDLDLMLKIAAEGNEDGWVDSRELVESLGSTNGKGSEISTRLAWMRRYGMLEFDDKARMWRLTSSAQRVTEAKLRAASAKTIDAIPEESLVDVMAHVTTRYRHGDRMTAELLRREFQFGTNPRSAIYRR